MAWLLTIGGVGLILLVLSDTFETIILEEVRRRLNQLRGDYEPYLQGVANYLAMDLPRWTTPDDEVDNWKTTAWDRERHS